MKRSWNGLPGAFQQCVSWEKSANWLNAHKFKSFVCFFTTGLVCAEHHFKLFVGLERCQQFQTDTHICNDTVLLGSGCWPDADPWGHAFSQSYMPQWFAKAGGALAGGWKAALDGVQADQEWLHRVFKLQRTYAD